MKSSFVSLAFGASLLFLGLADAHAFEKGGCGGGDCRDCHSLAHEEASKILRGWVDNVLAAEMSPVKGLWVVDVLKDGKKFPVYIDFSKAFLVNGQIIRFSTKEDITGTRYMNLNASKTDVSQIPLDDALVVGSPSARRKVVVFSDPDCHYCAKLHESIKTVVERTPDVAFYIKLYSRNNDPATVERAMAVICTKSLKLLEDAYARRDLPPAPCRSAAVEETMRLAEKLNIRGTPAMVLPDGRISGGYRGADALQKLLEEGSAAGAGK
ncbi:MAG: DsbC family protein [Deltaproteobacteria bacterium]|nr:DsbC family protein [Deltaproteobacteria bacterium]